MRRRPTSGATELVEKEREAQTKIIAAKDQQILSLSDFIAKARNVLSTEFKGRFRQTHSRMRPPNWLKRQMELSRNTARKPPLT